MNGRFPAMSLPVQPPLTPMEGRPAEALPAGAGWQYEPKWDGFRCLAFRDGRTVALQAKSGEPLTRYFPEVVMALANLDRPRFVLDGEIVVIGDRGTLAWEELMQRIHPSARRVAQLSAKTPATFLAFDLIAEGDDSLLALPLVDRRKRLDKFFAKQQVNGIQLSPATVRHKEALGWLRDLEPAGLDGLVAKRLDAAYLPGSREAMVKLKPEHTADCVVAGLRRREGGQDVGALLLGLYDEAGVLHFVGATALLGSDDKKALDKLLAPLLGAPAGDAAGFTGRQPGAETRLAHAKSRDWEPLRPALVAEVRFDRFAGDHFRHPPSLVRMRPDKKPAQCTFDQVQPPTARKGHGLELIGL